MPAKSMAQLRWVNSASGHKALGDAGVKEWDSATKGKKLPEKVPARKSANWMNAKH
jgi:hypothetical protein